MLSELAWKLQCNYPTLPLSTLELYSWPSWTKLYNRTNCLHIILWPLISGGSFMMTHNLFYSCSPFTLSLFWITFTYVIQIPQTSVHLLTYFTLKIKAIRKEFWIISSTRSIRPLAWKFCFLFYYYGWTLCAQNWCQTFHLVTRNQSLSFTQGLEQKFYDFSLLNHQLFPLH